MQKADVGLDNIKIQCTYSKCSGHVRKKKGEGQQLPKNVVVILINYWFTIGENNYLKKRKRGRDGKGDVVLQYIQHLSLVREAVKQILLRTNFCIRNKQLFGLYRLNWLKKSYSYIGTLCTFCNKVLFIHDSSLFKIWFNLDRFQCKYEGWT